MQLADRERGGGGGGYSAADRRSIPDYVYDKEQSNNTNDSTPRLLINGIDGGGYETTSTAPSMHGNIPWQRAYATSTPLQSPDVGIKDTECQMGLKYNSTDGSDLKWRERIRHFTWTWFTVSI